MIKNMGKHGSWRACRRGRPWAGQNCCADDNRAPQTAVSCQVGEEVEEEDGREVRQVGSGHWKGRSRRIRWLDARSDDG
jgi:hypothetical protein